MSDKLLTDTETSLLRVQAFDTQTLPQTQKLGDTFSFQDALIPANRTISLFKQIPIQYLHELPNQQLLEIKRNADAFYNVLGEILNFDTRTSDAYARRTSLIESLANQYQNYFDVLHPTITYTASRLRDYTAMEREARAAMQAAQDRATEIAKELEGQQQEASRILEEVRQTAAEQGVSQQASYFKSESENHDTQAENWRTFTLWLAGALGLYAAMSTFLHKIPWIAPNNTYDAVQLAVSKVLVFSVLAYVLFLSARNFLSHKHNSIVNRHRQNALLTFKALADAAGDEEKRDIVLTYAAACIFAPQDTGYTRNSTQTEMPTNLIQTIPKLGSSSPS